MNATKTITPALDALTTLARTEVEARGASKDPEAVGGWQEGFMAALDCMFLIPGTLQGFRRAVWREWMQFSPDITEHDIRQEGQRIANACIEAINRAKGGQR